MKLGVPRYQVDYLAVLEVGFVDESTAGKERCQPQLSALALLPLTLTQLELRVGDPSSLRYQYFAVPPYYG